MTVCGCYLETLHGLLCGADNFASLHMRNLGDLALQRNPVAK